MTLTANEVFRDYVLAGLPSSGAHKPKKEEVRALLTRMETELAAGLAQAQIGYKSRAELFQNLAPGEATLAIVRGDSTAEYNGIYRKSGASGTGSWTRIADLPDEIVRFTVTGGSPNAIEVAASPQVPAPPGNKLYLLTPVANNTGAVTIAIEGGAAVPIKT
ncbi:MAG: oxidoreductase, partial [Variibacter sp.]|nr:oxidoreductase [Variibacter sp.]